MGILPRSAKPQGQNDEVALGYHPEEFHPPVILSPRHNVGAKDPVGKAKCQRLGDSSPPAGDQNDGEARMVNPSTRPQGQNDEVALGRYPESPSGR